MQISQQIEKLRASSADRAEEAGRRLAARQQLLAEEREAMARKVQLATAPFEEEEEQQSVVVEALRGEVASLRWESPPFHGAAAFCAEGGWRRWVESSSKLSKFTLLDNDCLQKPRK